jgi:nucleotide-binding universal stress UspA family protein
MIRIAQDLCPVDFSEFSRRALHHARAVARWYEARLTVLYVHPDLSTEMLPVALGVRDRDQLMTELKEFTAAASDGVPIDLRVEEGTNVHHQILRAAESIDADLLVLGSHGRSGFERLLLGSVTEKILRKAPCPTLVVPRRAPDATGDEVVQYKRILCPVDFSDRSLRAVEYALMRAQERASELTLLHVIEVPPELEAFPLAGAFDREAFRAAAEADGLGRLATLIPDAARDYCTIAPLVRHGSAPTEILAAASERHSDLVVMGGTGRGVLDVVVFGSTAARVSRNAACPVLVTRAA